MMWRKTLLAASVMAVAAPVMASQPSDLHHILSMQSNPSKVAESATSGVKQVRSKAVYQAAETYSSQVAYCHQTKVLASLVNKEKAHLDKAYNFANLLLDGGRVIPPVIQQDDASYRQQGDNKAVTAQTTWHILKPARIVSAAPNWRNYLYLSCPKPLKPNPVLMPGGAGGGHKQKDEAAWQAGAKKGWKLGITQANTAFKLGLHRLSRDYKGMLRFWWLDHRGVVSTPILAQGHVGVKINGHTLSVGETVFRLTSGANWQPQKHWKPVIDGAVKIEH